MNKYDNIIIGGGASGLMCAAYAKGKTLIIERNKKFGNKVLASGGGCCNFSNLNISPENYLSHNPHFVKSALSQFGVDDFLEMLHRHKIKWEEREFGQLFAYSAQDILNMLIKEAGRENVDFLFSCEVKDVQKKDNEFIVRTHSGIYSAKNLIISSGGISYPKLGISKEGLNIAEQFGLEVYPLKPALCGLDYKEDVHQELSDLAGVSLKVKIKQNKKDFTDQLLFTHKGLSGPAALQMSVYFDENNPVEIDFLPDADIASLLEASKRTNEKPAGIFKEMLPKKLIKILSDGYDIGLANANKQQIAGIIERFSAYKIFCRLASFEKAEVMSGGINTDNISSKNMESKQVPGLFFTGEILDVTGQLGGYNLHWAWASAYACAINGRL